MPQDDPGARKRIQALLESPAYVRADQDTAFLELDTVRAFRLALDYEKAEQALEREGVRSTIVLFGGTRVVPEDEAKRRLDAAEAALASAPDDTALQRKLSISRRVLKKSRYYETARAFARLVSEAGQCGQTLHYVIATGGGPGIMEAGNRGAFEAGCKSVGFNITLPSEQFPNAYISPELCFQFRYFAMRKLHFMKRARALVAFPGGYGTMDEIFDALCLVQTRKIDALPIVLVGRSFWENAINIPFLVDEGVIDEEDQALIRYAETAEEIWTEVQRPIA